MGDQATPLSNNDYFRRFTPAPPATPQFERAIVRPDPQRGPDRPAPMAVNRGAAAVVRAADHPAIFSQTLEADASNFGLAMFGLASLCRAMYYPASGEEWFRRVCVALNNNIAVTLQNGNILPASTYRYSGTGGFEPKVGIFRMNPMGTILAVSGTSPGLTWNGQILWDTMCETSVFKDYLNRNASVGQRWLAWAQAMYTQLKADYAGLGGGNIIVTGHSMGGVLAAYLARLIQKDFPGKVKYVMAFGSPKPGDSKFGDGKSWNSGLVLPYYRVTTAEDPVGALPLSTQVAPWAHVMNGYWCIRSGGIINRNKIGYESPDFNRPPPEARSHRGVFSFLNELQGGAISPLANIEMFVRLYTELAGGLRSPVHMLKSYLAKTSYWVSKGLVDRNTQFGDLTLLVQLKQLMDALPSE